MNPAVSSTQSLNTHPTCLRNVYFVSGEGVVLEFWIEHTNFLPEISPCYLRHDVFSCSSYPLPLVFVRNLEVQAASIYLPNIP